MSSWGRLLVVSAFLVSAAAHAADESAAPAPSTATKLSTEVIKQPTVETDLTAQPKLSGDFNSWYRGPVFSKLDSSDTFGGTGAREVGSKQVFDNDIRFDYTVWEKYHVALGAYIPFAYQPAETSGNRTSWGDVGLRFITNDIVKTEQFGISNTVTIQAPSSDGSRQRDMSYSIKAVPYIWYKLTSMPLSFGSWFELKTYANVTEGAKNKAYACPYARYATSDSFVWQLMYEGESFNYKDDPSWQYRNSQTNWQPGFIWSITKTIELNPYMQIYANDGLDLDHTGIGAYLWAQVL